MGRTYLHTPLQLHVDRLRDARGRLRLGRPWRDAVRLPGGRVGLARVHLRLGAARGARRRGRQIRERARREAESKRERGRGGSGESKREREGERGGRERERAREGGGGGRKAMTVG
eukprot:6137297-Prymnesium_polylepis.1